MVYQDRPWQDNPEQPDQPTPNELPPNEDWPIDDYIEGLLSAPEPDDGNWGFAEDVTSDDHTDDW